MTPLEYVGQSMSDRLKTLAKEVKRSALRAKYFCALTLVQFGITAVPIWSCTSLHLPSRPSKPSFDGYVHP